jgi:hypothetical protein
MNALSYHYSHRTHTKPLSLSSIYLSQSIPKLLVLPIRHIRKFNIRLVSYTSFTSYSIPPLVLPLIVEPQHQSQHYSSSASNNNGDFCRDVGGCVRGAECQGSDDVAQTEGD